MLGRPVRRKPDEEEVGVVREPEVERKGAVMVGMTSSVLGIVDSSLVWRLLFEA